LCRAAGTSRRLRRLPAYHEPVPLEGLLKLGLAVSTSSTQRLPNPEALLERLLAVSLLEAFSTSAAGR
jgi:hypothetical protein